MTLRKFHKTMMYDDFDNKDYEGYIIGICMAGIGVITIISWVGWVMFLLR